MQCLSAHQQFRGLRRSRLELSIQEAAFTFHVAFDPLFGLNLTLGAPQFDLPDVRKPFVVQSARWCPY